ncbi:hypothetical protein F2Q68_00025291 [Brassica cretica]|uniref:Uncharacterized protein n=1 Tax=Brassica cretica TaxID=69181 RepID=A0A8S9IEV7_BRACR|nr:hypothetical protein F2Q68_00025291 [Brassica cretica]
MVASHDPFGSATASILYMYWATWSSGSVVPLYAFILGKENFPSISIKIAWCQPYRRTSGEGERSWETSLSLVRLMPPYQARVPSRCPLRLRVRCFQKWHGTNLSPESTLLVACYVKGFVLVSEGKILQFDLAELLDALLQLVKVFVEFFLKDLELQGQLGIGTFPNSM